MTPSHYQHTKIEPIKVINSINLGFNLGSAYKYLARAGYKGSKSQDIKKAIDFIGYEIETPTFTYNNQKVSNLLDVMATECENKLLCMLIKAICDYYTDDDSLNDLIISLQNELKKHAELSIIPNE